MKTYGFAQFCDDVRNEMDGKVTLIGLYRNDIIVPELPLLLPKFCVVLNVVTEEKKLNLPVEIEFGDEIIFQGTSDLEFHDDGLPKNVKSRSANFSFIFSPLILSNEEMLLVRVQIDGEWSVVGQIYIHKFKKQKSLPKKAKKKAKGSEIEISLRKTL